MGDGPSNFSNGLNGKQPDPASVRAALHRVLQSSGFRSSRRSQDFLRYVVERTLDGQADNLKERTIGIDVFGRPADYDPSDDATVRVKAGEVRKRLGLYYAEQGARNPIRIDLPLGSYVPEFRESENRAAPAQPSGEASVSPPQAQPKMRLGTRVAAGAMLLAVLSAAFVWLRTRPANTPLDQFWGPGSD